MSPTVGGRIRTLLPTPVRRRVEVIDQRLLLRRRLQTWWRLRSELREQESRESWPPPRAPLPRQRPPSRAVVVHGFHVDLLPGLLAQAANAAGPVFVTLPDDDLLAQRRRIVEDHCGSAARILVTANRGRDVGPFAALVATGDLDEFDVVFKVHTKASDDITRERLSRALLGTRERAEAVIGLLYEEPGVSLVGDPFHIDHEVLHEVSADLRRRIYRLCRSADIAIPLAYTFVGGTMFAIRRDGLARFKALGLGVDSFVAESDYGLDSRAHAVERFFGIREQAAGMRVAGTSMADLFRPVSRLA